MENQFTVCTSVYKNDKTSYIKVALDSILVNQTIRPSEIVVVIDGSIPEATESLLKEYHAKYPTIFTFIKFNQNQGIGQEMKTTIFGCA